MESSSGSAAVGGQKQLNFRYFISLHGIFRIIEFVIGIIVCSCVGGAVCNSIGCFTPSFAPGSGYEGQGFVLFVGVICILCNALFVVLNVLNLVDQPRSTLKLIEFGYTAVGTLLYFIAAIVEAAYAGGSPGWFRSNWIAAAVFAWFNLALYAVDTFFQWQRNRQT